MAQLAWSVSYPTDYRIRRSSAGSHVGVRSWTMRLAIEALLPYRAVEADPRRRGSGTTRLLRARGEFPDPEKNSPRMIPRCYGFRNGDWLFR
jgi:hypothetical protein